ncbi:MAG: DUF1836 domain-containing protein [Clostridiales bacterium]|nr:DUF1836 domain-containing protein [Clostridiales bacterium]
MDFNKEVLEIAKEIADFKMVDSNDIPKIDLYMEQVISFLEQEMGDSLRRNDENVFTSTMINNYTKAGVLPRPENKKYNRRHILTLIYIFMLKQNLSMPEIKAFTSSIQDTQQLEKMYDIFYSVINEVSDAYVDAIEDALKIIDHKLEDKHSENDELTKALTFISFMSFQAMISTMICGKLLESEKLKLTDKKETSADDEKKSKSADDKFMFDKDDEKNKEKIKAKIKIKGEK